MTEPTDAPVNSPVTGDVPGQSRTPPEPRVPFVRAIPGPVRFVLGYVIAVSAGAVVFTVLFEAAFDGNFDQLDKQTILYFVLGLVFGLPYTILGSLAFHNILPRNAGSFMLTGTLCPVAAILLFDIVIRSFPGTPLTAAQLFGTCLVSLPSGLIAAYLYGAIGFGFGFGRWRIG